MSAHLEDELILKPGMLMWPHAGVRDQALPCIICCGAKPATTSL